MKYFLCVIIFCIISSKSIWAKVVVNEFLIDSAPQKVELYNTASESSMLGGWYIDDNGGTTYYTIAPNTIIAPNSCLVFSGDFNLNKSSSDQIRLFDSSAPPTTSSAQLKDSFTYKSSPGENISFGRFPDGSDIWSTQSASLGFLNTTQIQCVSVPTITPIPSTTPSHEDEEEMLPLQSFTNIYISEVMTYPEDSTEWVELYNDNEFSVSLVNWHIDDIENAGSSPQIITTDLPPHGYSVYLVPHAIFNNDQDSVRLINSEGEVADSFEYENSQRDKTWGRTSLSSDIFCIQSSSYGETNKECIENTPSQRITHSLTQDISRSPIPVQLKSNLITSYTKKIIPVVLTPGNTIKGTVLGEQRVLDLSQRNTPPIYQPFIQSFLFSTIVISLLNIVYILFKMKGIPSGIPYL